MTAQVDDFATWAKNQAAKQAKLKPHDVPVFTSSDFLAKLDDVRLAFAKVKNKKKPKPPPAPAPAANGELDAGVRIRKIMSQPGPQKLLLVPTCRLIAAPV